MKSALFTALLSGLFLAQGFGSALAAAPEKTEPKTLTMKVDRLACLPCAKKFKEELSSVCRELILDTIDGKAVCRYEDPVTPKQILKKANKTGLPTQCVGETHLVGEP
jgi:hypothetical protein